MIKMVGALRLTTNNIPIITDGECHFFLAAKDGGDIAEKIFSALASGPNPCVGIVGEIVHDAFIVQEVYL